MREYGTHYLGYRAGYLVDAFATLKYGHEWFPFHTYDAIVLRQYSRSPDLLRRLLDMLPYGDTTPVVILEKYDTPPMLPDVQHLISAHQPVFSVPLHEDPIMLFFELNQVIEMVVSRRKLMVGMQSLAVLLRRFGRSQENQPYVSIGDIVRICGKYMSAIFAAYLRIPGQVLSPAAEWHAGECHLRYVPADYAMIPVRSWKVRRGQLSPGWTCSEDGRIEWTGKGGKLSVILYPVRRPECENGILSIVYPLSGLPADHELLMVETCADLISWHEHLAAQPLGEICT